MDSRAQVVLMLDEIPYEPDKPIPPLSRRAHALGLVAWVVFLGLTAIAAYFLLSLWTDLIRPYRSGGPVINVSFGALSTLGLFPAIFSGLVMVTITWIGYLAGWKRRDIDSKNKKILPVTLGSSMLAVAMWVIVGPTISSHLSSRGYQYCSELSSDIGINYYRRAYVIHAYLCVGHKRLAERLAVYHRLEAARETGRLRDAMIQEGFSVDEQGRLLYPPEDAQ